MANIRGNKLVAKNIFEMNGKAYDALTGEYLGESRHIQHETAIQTIAVRTPKSQGVSIDGMVGSAGFRQRTSAGAPSHTSHLKPQPTRTLKRQAVIQPAPASLAPAKQGMAASSPLGATGPAPAVIQQKQPHQAIDPMRAHRARRAGRSQSVQHFRASVPTPANPYAMPAGPAPKPAAAPAIAPAITINSAQPAATFRSAQSTGGRTAQNYRQQFAAAARRPVPANPLQSQAAAHNLQAKDDDQELFEQALTHATSHEQPAPKQPALKAIKQSRKRRQLLGIIGSLSVFLLLAGFIGYQNRNDIRLQLASAKAGFSASVPLYKPSGYSLAKLDYAPGSVATSFKSLNDQSFTVTQKKSNWDSQTLLENFVATSNENYKGYQSNGRTVYVYGKGKATWVNGGVWYQLKDTGGLSDEQLVKIAASM